MVNGEGHAITGKPGAGEFDRLAVGVDVDAADIEGGSVDRLLQETASSGRWAVFNELEGCLLVDRPAETYAQLGSRLGLSETAVKVTVHRLRQRYRELLREEVAHTVTRPEELEAEMRHLLAVVSR